MFYYVCLKQTKQQLYTFSGNFSFLNRLKKEDVISGYMYVQRIIFTHFRSTNRRTKKTQTKQKKPRHATIQSNDQVTSLIKNLKTLDITLYFATSMPYWRILFAQYSDIGAIQLLYTSSAYIHFWVELLDIARKGRCCGRAIFFEDSGLRSVLFVSVVVKLLGRGSAVVWSLLTSSVVVKLSSSEVSNLEKDGG